MKLHNWIHRRTTNGIWLGFGILILVLTITIFVSYWLVHQSRNDIDQVVNTQVPLEQSTWLMKSSITTSMQLINNHSHEKNLMVIEQARTLEDSFETSLTQFINIAPTSELIEKGQELADLHEEYVYAQRATVNLINQQHTSMEAFLEDIREVKDTAKNRLYPQINQVDPDAATKIEAVSGMEISLISLSKAVENYTVQPDSVLYDDIQKAQQVFAGYPILYGGLDISVMELSWLSEISGDFDELSKNAENYIKLTDNLHTSLGQYEQNNQQIIDILDTEIFPLLKFEMINESNDAENSLNSIITWILVLGLPGLVFGSTIAWFIPRHITRSLRRLKEGAMAVADGKIDHRFYIDTKDEFGQISLALNQILENLTRSREALGESEETAWQLLDATTDSVFLMDIRGMIVASNEIAASRYNKSLEQMIDASYYDLLPADLMASRKAQITEVIRTGKPFHFEEDREGMVLDTRIFPVIDPEKGRVSRIAIFARDITTRKWVEDVTESLGRRNELILESAGEGIYGLDTQGKTTFVNPAAARMLGYRPEDLIGQHHHELVHHSKANGMPYPSHQCPIYAAFKDGTVRTNIDNEVFWRKDGTSFSVEYTSTPIIEDCKIMGAVVTFRDITERKHLETTLRRREERYRTIFESPPTLIVSIDFAGVVIDCNPLRMQKILGYQPDEVVGQRLVRFIQEDYHSIVQGSFEEVIEKGVDYNNRYKMTRKDGTVIDVNVNYASVKNDIDEHVRTICMIDDITELVQS